MTWKDSQFSRPLYMNQLSEGTLRFLWLVTLLQTPAATKLTLLDEPETSLHPELLSLLAGLLREASQRTQLIIATQSDALVRFLQPSEVLAMDLPRTGRPKRDGPTNSTSRSGLGNIRSTKSGEWDASGGVSEGRSENCYSHRG